MLLGLMEMTVPKAFPRAGDTPSTAPPGQDPRRWITLLVVSMAAVIVALDQTILTVAIPTILRDFHTSLVSVQWVITGYALTYASLLIIGGRLGDIFGHRRTFIVGAGLFGFGSLIAALSQNVPQLILGEAVIEGIGAALMMPATLAILSNAFVGHERSMAFGVWGTVAGASNSLGPVLGGVLTSSASWRWSFGINVIVVPIAITGAMLFMVRDRPSGRREPLDVQGSLLIASGMVLLVFGLSDGATYGWVRPTRVFRIGGVSWPDSMPVSVVFAAFIVSAGLLTAFVLVELAKERRHASPLFQFGEMGNKAFRYGLIVTMVMALGMFGMNFVLPIFLQEGRGLSAQLNGLWLLPVGVSVLIGAQVAARLGRRVDVLVLVRVGIGLAAAGFLYVASALSSDVTFLRLMPGMAMFGAGFGMAVAQLTNIVMSGVSREKTGAAGGANNTSRQIGGSIGIALIGSLLASRTTAAYVDRVAHSDAISATVRDSALPLARDSGVSFAAPPGISAQAAGVLRRMFVDSLVDGARTPLIFAASAMAAAVALSFLVPRRARVDETSSAAGSEAAADLPQAPAH
jgi:EmrB/QacA subfamily drug resistance transporter